MTPEDAPPQPPPEFRQPPVEPQHPEPPQPLVPQPAPAQVAPHPQEPSRLEVPQPEPVRQDVPLANVPQLEVPSSEPDQPVVRAIDLDLRRRLVQRFEAWIDRAAADEPPPAGIPAELLAAESTAEPSPPGADLYDVVAGLTGLTGEVRLQGRAFRQLAEVLSPLAELPRQFEQLAASLEPTEPADDADVALPSPKAMLEVLLDLHDRLARGLRNAESTAAPVPPGWFDRLLGRPPAAGGSVVSAMRDGYAMTLSRLTAALHQWDVEPIGQAGGPFDPRRMVAIDVRSGTGQPPGTVVEVNRSGCSVRGSVLMVAQVTVAK